MRRSVALLPSIFLGACGYIANPLPPTLDIPVRVVDLRTAEDGDKILVEFTIPALTTEGLPLKTLRKVELFAGPQNTPFNADTWAPTARHFEIPVDSPGPVAFDQISVQAWVGQSVAVGVRVTGPKGKLSEWSNIVPLTVGQPLAAPTDLIAENTQDGVKLTWTGSGPRYRIFRSSGDTQPTALGESEQPEYLDNSAQFGTAYRYMVMAFEGDTRRSVVSESKSSTPIDMFPPAVPTGVTAASGNNAIELAWVRNTESDFRGYNIYRAEGDGPFTKITPMPIDTPNFSDTMVMPGKTYRYQITSVDLVGNESARSEPVPVALL